MAADRRKRMARKVIFVLGIPSLLLISIALFGGTFGRGIAVGALGSIAAILVFAKIMQRAVAKRAPRQFDPPPLPTATWDYSMEAHDLSGAAVSFERFKGRVAVLNFWATWCVPCTAEMPSLFRLQEKTSEFGVHFAFLSNEKSEVVRKFSERHGWSGPLYQLSGESPECFRTRGIPATFVVDKSGRIAMRHFGAARWDDESIVGFLRGLAVTPTG